MVYVRLNDNIVEEIIPEFDPTFPNVPIEQRYPADFVSGLIKVEDGIEVRQRMVYDVETGEFTEPVVPEPESPEIEPIVPVSFEELKQDKIIQTKVALAEWLNTHPMLYTDEKYYSVTEEKQTLLNSNLASYERAEKIGMIYPLKWNAVGEECVEWSYTNLTKLSLAIAAYVGERVSRQQILETQIQACETLEELEAIEVNYD